MSEKAILCSAASADNWLQSAILLPEPVKPQPAPVRATTEVEDSVAKLARATISHQEIRLLLLLQMVAKA